MISTWFGPLMRLNSQAETKWGTLLAVVAIGFLLRLWLMFGNETANSPEVFEYDELARNVLSGRGYVYTHLGTTYQSFYSGIFYIWLTAGLYVAFPPGQTAVLVAQSLISSVLAVVMFLIGRILWSQRAGLLAALLTISHPAFVYYDTHKLHPLSFDSLMTSLVVFALLWVRGSRHAGAPLLAGLVLGAAILQRGTLLLLLPLGLLWLWFFNPRHGRLLRHTAGYLLGVMLVVTPWVARNHLIHGAPLLLTVTAEHFWLGNTPHSYGSNLLPSGQTVLDAAPEGFHADLLSRNEWGQSRLFWQSSIASVRAYPWVFLFRMVRKFLNFWTFAPQTGLLYPRSFFYIYTVYYFVIAALAVLGAVRLVRGDDSRPAALSRVFLILAVFLSVSTIQSIFYVELRHRWGIEPLLLFPTAVGLLSTRRWVKGGAG